MLYWEQHKAHSRLDSIGVGPVRTRVCCARILPPLMPCVKAGMATQRAVMEPPMDPTPDDRAHLERQRAEYRKNLHHLEDQVSSYGSETHTPLHVRNQLDETRAILAAIEADLGL